jgi:hypothetical protein
LVKRKRNDNKTAAVSQQQQPQQQPIFADTGVNNTKPTSSLPLAKPLVSNGFEVTNKYANVQYLSWSDNNNNNNNANNNTNTSINNSQGLANFTASTNHDSFLF